MAVDTKLIIDRHAAGELTRTQAARQVAIEAGNEFAGTARGFAPHRTGAGAASIKARRGRRQGEAVVSWDRRRHYMYFQQAGTKFMPANAFMDRALDHYATI